jgi:hypothetical protein
MADRFGEKMRVTGLEAKRQFIVALWQERLAMGLYFSFTAVWILFLCCAWWVSSSVGLGSSWSAPRVMVSCSGAVGELFIALLLPLIGLIGDEDAHGRYGAACGRSSYVNGHGRYGRDHDAPVDKLAVAITCALGAFILALDLVRFAAPSMTGAPQALQMMAGAWWFFIDLIVTLVGAGVWCFIGVAGLKDVYRKATELDEKGHSRIELSALNRHCRRGRSARNHSSAKRL